MPLPHFDEEPWMGRVCGPQVSRKDRAVTDLRAAETTFLRVIPEFLHFVRVGFP
jgi:hypothetical protein